jgi:hypothetical protein
MPVTSTEPTAQRGLTTADVANRFRVGEDKVRRWIETGELHAINTATVICAKPRWVITADALAAFERRRSSAPLPKPARRRRREQIDHFADLPDGPEGGAA